MSSSISETTRSRKEPCLESREVREQLEFHVSPRNTVRNQSALNVSGTMFKISSFLSNKQLSSNFQS